jgi:phosphoglycerol transferase MdoB-like AlkP superfamily enzyme
MNNTFQALSILLKRLLALLALYSLCRLLFYAFNHSHFPDLNIITIFPILFYGIYFDISTVLLLNLIFIFFCLLPFPIRNRNIYRIVLKYIFIIINSVALFANCVDLAYFKFTLKRTTADVFSFFGGGIGNDLLRLLPTFLKEYWYVFLIWGILTYFLVIIYKKTEKTDVFIKTAKSYLFQFSIFLISLALSIIISRGGIQLRPIGIVNAGEFTEGKNVPLVLNTPFSILKTIEVRGITPQIYFKDEKDLLKYYNPRHLPAKGEFRKLNVFVIALESFSKEYIGSINGKHAGYTPFLDSLISESLVCVNAFANGKKSIEGIPAIISSIPTWSDEPYLTSRYGNNQVCSLANLLKEQGYNTSFFHGGTNGTMGFDAFAKLIGYDNYYGRTEYNNEKDYDGNWGIWDEEFLQYTANTVTHFPQPFFTTLFTLTSHHPYPIPAKYKGKFKEGPLEIEKTIGYTDYSLKKFFETAKTTPWFKNTLFVLVADHTGISNDQFFSNRIGNYSIPIIYYLPESKLKGIDSTITQQIDIMPSVLDYLHYPKAYFTFGSSLFDSTASHFAMNYINGSYHLYENYYSSEFTGTKKTDLYYYKTDSLLQHDISSVQPVITKKMENRTKAIIQTYQQSILNNKMK